MLHLRSRYLNSGLQWSFFICAMILTFDVSAASLKDNLFWQASSGFWVSKNTYLDGEYKPKIPHYHTLNAISVSAKNVTSEERKFYPPGAFAASQLGLDIPANKGVELIQVSHGLATADNRVDFAALNSYSLHQSTWIETVSGNTAVMTVTDKQSGELSYKMLITLPTNQSRITASLGVNGHFNGEDSTTPLRGVSVFAARRIDADAFEKMTLALQKQYDVGAIVTIDENGKFQAELIQ